MKKSIIAAGAASVALAALPMAGVFAASTKTVVNDNISVSVPGSCTIEGATTGNYTNNDRTFDTKAITAGTYDFINDNAEGTGVSGQAFTVHCTTSTGNWSVGITTSDGALKADTPANGSIAAGDATSGNTSAWAIKSNAVAATGGSLTTDNYATYTAYDATDKSVFLSAAAKAGAGATFNPSYRVYVAPDQAADTYRGTITYTISYSN